MLIRGLDFSLSKSNPLVEGDLDKGSLRLERVQRLARGAAPLEGLLRREGSWILGVDFPFGFPTAFLDEVDWGSSWEDYVRTASSLEKSEFVDQICRFREPKPGLQKHPKRLADRLARSQSPLTTDYVPVARMFWAGARHLVEADCDVVPFRSAGKGRVVVEAYPALVARRLIGGNKYKDGSGDGRTAEARGTLIALIERGELSRAFGLDVSFGASLRAECIGDEPGDVLDSALCAIQAAWAYGERRRNWGAPANQQVEGWIPDPSLVEVDAAGTFVPIHEGSALPAPPPGSFNSSKTRVQPLFRALLAQDPTGASWLPQLLSLAPRNREKASELAASAGPLRAQTFAPSEPFERAFPPPVDLLRWCLHNPDQLAKSRTAEKASKHTRDSRLKFFRRDSPESRELREQALNELSSPCPPARAWWAFEGFTSVDCCLETNSLVLFVEGKRLESPSQTVSWLSTRNQIARNLEVAAQYARSTNRDFAVLLIGPDGVTAPADHELHASWPHLSEATRTGLLRHFIGAVAWRRVCEAVGIAYDSLPVMSNDPLDVRFLHAASAHRQ